MYEAILFDNDGVLVEFASREALVRATREAFAAVGVTDPDPDHVETLSTGTTVSRLREVCDAYGLDPARFWAVRDRHSSRAQRAEVSAGRVALYDDFDAVRRLSAPLGIVSSNQQATVDFVHDHFGTRGLFGATYGRPPTLEALARKKPDPHYLDRALADLGVESGDVLFVGDSDVDVLAAANAGVDSAFVRRPHRTGYDLPLDPTHELDGLEELFDVPGVPVGDAATERVSAGESDVA